MEEKNFNTEDWCFYFPCTHMVILSQFMLDNVEKRGADYNNHIWNDTDPVEIYADPEQQI